MKVFFTYRQDVVQTWRASVDVPDEVITGGASTIAQWIEANDNLWHAEQSLEYTDYGDIIELPEIETKI